MTLWLVVLGMGLVNYHTRMSAILLLERASLPPPVARALRFIPPAVLLAMVAPALARPAGVLALSVGNPRLLAGAVAAVVAARTRSVVATTVAGMATLWALEALVHWLT
jgi:branched-subunit amino acid transport protein